MNKKVNNKLVIKNCNKNIVNNYNIVNNLKHMYKNGKINARKLEIIEIKYKTN
jgi:hypothetical protein